MSPNDPVHEVLFKPGPDYWEVTCRGRYPGHRLLVALASVLPPGLTLYLEGTSIAPIVGAFLADRPAAHPVSVRRGVIWPRPKTYHMPMTTENVAGLAELMKDLAEPEVADHIHAYRDDFAYLIWYDAWFDSPLYLHEDVPEDVVRQLCGAFDCEYASVA